MCLEKVFKSVAIWFPNSLVGERMIVCGLKKSWSVKFNNGKPNAAVFPVPV